MCLTIPAQVIMRNGNKATILNQDRTFEIDVSLIGDVEVGDWVLYISNVALKKIDTSDAEELLDLLTVRPQIEPSLLNLKFNEIIKKSYNEPLNREEIVYLLGVEGLEKRALFGEADVVRKTYVRDFVCVHGIIEFSNYCRNNCLYCGLRKDNENVKRYRMDIDEIVKTANWAVNDIGYKILVLQSGEDTYYTQDMLVDIVRRIKQECQVFLIMSIGDRDYITYKKMREAGANGVLFRFETSNPELFKALHAEGKNYISRFEHLKFMKELGYFIDFEDWVYIKNIGFFSKQEKRIGLPIRPGLVVKKLEIANFIEMHKEELEQIAGFFMFDMPIEKIGVNIYLNEDMKYRI